MKSNLYGNTSGLKKAQLKALERIEHKAVDPHDLASWELIKTMADLSRDLRRQIGIFIDRKGRIGPVFLGSHNAIQYPTLKGIRDTPLRLNGYRVIHTCLNDEGLSQRDLSELQTKRFDLVAAIAADEKGFPGDVHIAHIHPQASDNEAKSITALPPTSYPNLDLSFPELISSLEEEFGRVRNETYTVSQKNRALLCAIRTDARESFDEDLSETEELARSVGLNIAERVIQRREKPDAKHLLGEGRIREVFLRASQVGADTLLFQQNLSPNQMRHITDATQLKVLDRTQLILDIFARRAKTHEGKLQVELAQLRYMLPRLREKEEALSRLVGGIGGRGPGETTLEVQKRRAKDRVHRLEKEIDQISEKRAQRRNLRSRKEVPIVSIVGYTNAGKSTLLNALTQAEAFVENRPFSTLDPFSKRLRFPKDREIVLTDTVGFLRDLPKDLYFAFRATLEEIGEADLLLHVVDLSKPDFKERMEVVNKILEELEINEIPQLLVFNKSDLVPDLNSSNLARMLKGVAISALNPKSTLPLLDQIESRLWRKNGCP